MKERKYLIWSNENDAWLATLGNGFTKELGKAGVYDEEYAVGWLSADKDWLIKPHNMLYPADLMYRIVKIRQDKAKDDADRFPNW